MKTQEEYAFDIDDIVRRDVGQCRDDWFKIDRGIFMDPKNSNKPFILATRETGCDLLVIGGTNCHEEALCSVFGYCRRNKKFYLCQPASFLERERSICEVDGLHAFMVTTSYFIEKGYVPILTAYGCKLTPLPENR